MTAQVLFLPEKDPHLNAVEKSSKFRISLQSGKVLFSYHLEWQGRRPWRGGARSPSITTTTIFWI